MDSHFSGEVVVQEIIPEHMAEVEALIENPAAVGAVPDEMEIENAA